MDVVCRLIDEGFNYQKIAEEISLIKDEYISRTKAWKGLSLRNGLTGENSTSEQSIILTNSSDSTGVKECFDTKYLKDMPYTSEILNSIASRFGTKLGLVRILKLCVGGKITPHVDTDLFNFDKGKIYRFHLVVATNPDVNFMIKGHCYNFEQGSLYFTDVSHMHSVENNGTTDRYHIVMDFEATAMLKEIILNGKDVSYQTK